MTVAIFYSMKRVDDLARLHLACGITKKAVSQGHKIHIYTDNEEQSRVVDELLWSFQADSFLPHVVIPKKAEILNDKIAITIGQDEPPSADRDVLINLSSRAIDESETYNRLCELFCGSNDAVDLARQRYKFYRNKGHELRTHKIE